ncbi:MAG: GGDEF domain-containing protein [Sarcina sp.]
MSSTLESQDFNFENYEMTNKLNNMLFKLLCMDNFYEALDYIVLELGELFNIKGIFTIELSGKQDLAVYRAYNQEECIGIKREMFNKAQVLEMLSTKDYIFVECGQKERLLLGFEPITDMKGKKKFLPYKEIIKRILATLYKRKLKEEYLTEKSFYDALTGCYNRNFFELKMKEYRSAVGIGIIVCDMDRLKQINDSLGHSFGDDIIKIFSRKLKANIEKDDFIFRIGGDEFVIITENKSLTYLQELVLKIKKGFKTHNEKSYVFPISVSIGYHMKSESKEGIKDVLRRADYLMYQDKMENREVRELAINKYILAMKKLKNKNSRIN